MSPALQSLDALNAESIPVDHSIIKITASSDNVWIVILVDAHFFLTIKLNIHSVVEAAQSMDGAAIKLVYQSDGILT